MKYYIENIASIVKGKWIAQHENAVIAHLLIDSRRLIFPPTSLFFALQGPRRDGHAFIEQLYEKGVRNFVVSDAVDTTNLAGSQHFTGARYLAGIAKPGGLAS